MSMIRQESLLNIDVLYNLEPTQGYDDHFSTASIAPILQVVGKNRDSIHWKH